MPRLHKVAQLYGYIVCLVTVLTFLFSIRPLIGALFDLRDPLHAGGYFGMAQVPSHLTSLEAYKMEKLKHVIKTEYQSPFYTPDEEAFREMYEAARADRIASARLSAQRTLSYSSITMFVCIVLFSSHWAWLRRLAARPD